MNVYDFAKHLVKYGDLDPVYIALNYSGYPDAQKLRWLMAYSAFYHCGVASYLSSFSGNQFWKWMFVAAENKKLQLVSVRWPRGHERRHFRGLAAMHAVESWKRRYGPLPEVMFTYIAEGGPTVAGVMKRAMEHLSVGPWLAFKCADLVDACLKVPLDQSDAAPFMYAKPKESLLRIYNEEHPRQTIRPAESEAISIVSQKIFASLKKYSIPHKPGQPLDLFCLETIACKHGSHVNGHYPLYNDIREIREGLQGWGPSADKFLAAMPALPGRLF